MIEHKNKKKQLKNFSQSADIIFCRATNPARNIRTTGNRWRICGTIFQPDCGEFDGTTPSRCVALFCSPTTEHLVVDFGNRQLFSQKPHVLFYRLHLYYDVIIIQARLVVRVEALQVAVVVTVELRVPNSDLPDLRSGSASGRMLI